jgi:hypothetical protein
VKNRATTVAMLFILGAGLLVADGPALRLRASGIGAAATAPPITIELWRWSTDGERAPLLAALSARPAPPAAEKPVPAGRAGRGARGGPATAPPPSPIERLTAAINAAPTVGFIWSDSPTGYSVKYAWRAASPGGHQRVVLAIDRRLGANSTSWPHGSGAAADAEFTVMEVRIDGKGLGEAKASLTSPVVVDADANTLALDGYADAPALLKVTR